MDYEFSSAISSPVLVIGAAVQDIVGITRGNLSPGTSSPGKIRKSFGGVARNVAENLARLGQPVILLTVVGQDETGESILEYLGSAGVDVSFVMRHTKISTGTYLALVDEKGWLQYAMADVRILSALTPAYLDLHSDLFSKASLVFIDANLNKDVIRKIFTLARAAKVPICADPTSILLADRFKPYLKRIKIITPNILEAEILCGFPIDPFNRQEALDAAKCLVTSGVEISIITLAELGVCYATSETTGQVPALRTQVVDPTGGGDALTAAVIFALLNGVPLDDAIRLGISASSLTLQYSGTVVPDLSLEKLYDRLVI
jgi:pseudouridine kinase